MNFGKTDHKTLTPAEAARRLRVQLDYVYQLIWAEKLQAIKEDGRWRIPADAIEQRLKRRENRRG